MVKKVKVEKETKTEKKTVKKEIVEEKIKEEKVDVKPVERIKRCIPNAVLPVIIAIIVAVIVSFIVKTAGPSYASDFGPSDTTTPVGLFSIFKYAILGSSYSTYLVVFILAVGAFYGVLNSSPNYKRFVGEIAGLFKNYKYVFIVISLVILSVSASIFGNYYALVAFLPFIIAIILALGYDKIMAAIVSIGSISAGIFGATFASKIGAYKTISESIGQTVTLDPNKYVVAKIIALVVSIVALVGTTLLYNKSSLAKGELEKEDSVKDERFDASYLVFIIIFALTFVVLFLATIPWEAFNVKFFAKITEAVLKNNTISNLFGFSAFGAWEVPDIAILLTLSSLILAIIYSGCQKGYSILGAYGSGIKKVVKPALLVFFIYTIFGIEIRDYGSYAAFIQSGGFMTKLLTANKFSVFTMSLNSFISHFYLIEANYSAMLTVPNVITMVGKKYDLIILVWQYMKGLSVIIAPTSVLLIGMLSYLNVSYGSWLRRTWIYILATLAAGLLIPLVLL